MKWIKYPDEKPPKPKSRDILEYYLVAEEGNWQEASWDGKYWDCTSDYWGIDNEKITHWMKVIPPEDGVKK